MDFNLKITNVKTASYPNDFPLEDQSNDKLEKVITIIDFDYTGSVDGQEYKVSGSRGVAVPVKDSFTDYNSLNESQVKAWLESNITKIDYRTMQKQIEKQVPVADSEPSLPWS
tara:strand:+ start:999 stop:1337 length:339 start_codon:yes stop_codon:yes gene_type:complete